MVLPWMVTRLVILAVRSSAIDVTVTSPMNALWQSLLTRLTLSTLLIPGLYPLRCIHVDNFFQRVPDQFQWLSSAFHCRFVARLERCDNDRTRPRGVVYSGLQLIYLRLTCASPHCRMFRRWIVVDDVYNPCGIPVDSKSNPFMAKRIHSRVECIECIRFRVKLVVHRWTC